MKKRRKKTMINVVLATILVLAVVLVATLIQTPAKQVVERVIDPFQNVKKYRSDMHDELAKYHMEKYTTVLLALMQQESRGSGGDPMQASESAGLAPNSINDPKESIRLGVKHFRRVLSYGEEKKVDFPTILQAYNMGAGYINYVAEHGGKHSEKLAKAFSLIQVHKKPKVYDCGGNKNNFRYPYCYGDYTYSAKVEKNINVLNETVQVNQTEKTEKKPF
ncbi:lysozyme family protein [Camelliibacillus cellulosilyticus]|uniref:Lysozyme family protein n=1 Tax=Camelliibacillus cellulosilyticus TaxID=2174486 RepID=A0ABV9GKE9_9BACL